MNNKIFIAIDTNKLSKAKKIIQATNTKKLKIGYKFGLEFINSKHGRSFISKINNKIIFLDLKLHDIPNTVKKGMQAIYKMRPLLTTIHISGGDNMISSSLINRKNMKILGVSILTSLDEKQTYKYYNERSIKNLVIKFVKQAKKLNLDGIVCSPKEIKYIREKIGNNFIIVTPGIRLDKSNKKDDQKRIMTPLEAIKMGANYLVIGRPILESVNPLQKLKEINKSLN